MSQVLQTGQLGCGQEDPLPSIVSSSSWRKMLQRNLRSAKFPNSLTKIPPRTIHVINCSPPPPLAENWDAE